MIMSGYDPGKDTHTLALIVSRSLQDKILPGAVLTAARNLARTPAARIGRERETTDLTNGKKQTGSPNTNTQTVCFLSLLL